MGSRVTLDVPGVANEGGGVYESTGTVITADPLFVTLNTVGGLPDNCRPAGRWRTASAEWVRGPLPVRPRPPAALVGSRRSVVGTEPVDGGHPVSSNHDLWRDSRSRLGEATSAGREAMTERAVGVPKQ
jgi:hypothetical protein